MSSSVISNFPYTVENEPTSDWTVEQALQWCLLKANQSIDDRYDMHESKIQELFATLENQLVETHQQQAKIRANEQQEQENQRANSVPNSAESSSKATTATAAITSSTKPAKTKKQQPKLKVEIIGGYAQGQMTTLQPRPRAPCLLGRSQGKKFRERGISLPKDLEVSTTHGKFIVDGTSICFVDTGSTNGSHLNGESLTVDVPYALRTGDILTCGATKLQVTLL